MRPFDNLSLSWKIPLRVMAAVIGTALAVTSALLVRDYEDVRANLDAHAKSLSRVMANTLVAPVLHDDLWRAYEILASARDAQPVAVELETQIMLVLDAEQRVFVANRPREWPVGTALLDASGSMGQLARALREIQPLSQWVFDPEAAAYHFIVTPLIADGVLLGHLALGYARLAFLPRYLDMVARAALVTLLALILLLPVSWIWARRTARPLIQLARAMAHLPAQPEAARLVELPRGGDELGQLGRAFGHLIDELKRKQELESQMLASERLAAVGRLSAGIAHEINNPLGGMLTALRTWQRHGGHDPLAQQTCSLLERGLSQIRNTVAALLVETKIQDRRFEPADVDDLLILVEPQAQARQVHLHRAGGLSADLPLPATLIRQILLNLLLNAINAAAYGGSVRLTLADEEGLLRLSVCNDGEHIPEERMAYLFEPFAGGQAKGHGLGLWVVYQIVRQLNGGLTVDSEPGCTTFHIEIPYGDTH